MIDVKKIKHKVNERKRISLDSFLDMMETLMEMKKYGTKRVADRNKQDL